MPYYCTVPRCTSMAGKAKNVSFHQFPRDEELAKLWNKILKRGKPYTKYSKVCSLHFKPEDYTIVNFGKNKGPWRTLRKGAIPSQNLPSESPTPYQRKQWGSWGSGTPPNVMDTTIQQQMAQAIYMQTMLAMQAAGAADTNLHNIGPEQQDPQTSSDKRTLQDVKSSYQCTECSKCFKDPDVFTLHRRSHNRHKGTPKIETSDLNSTSNSEKSTNFSDYRHSNTSFSENREVLNQNKAFKDINTGREVGPEKENLNLNLTLKSNPILANLLKTNNENANIYDGNVNLMENLLMTALAANMESYLRSLSLINDNPVIPNKVGQDNDNGINDIKNNDRLSQSNDKVNGFVPINDDSSRDSVDSGTNKRKYLHLNGNFNETKHSIAKVATKYQNNDFNKNNLTDFSINRSKQTNHTYNFNDKNNETHQDSDNGIEQVKDLSLVNDRDSINGIDLVKRCVKDRDNGNEDNGNRLNEKDCVNNKITLQDCLNQDNDNLDLNNDKFNDNFNESQSKNCDINESFDSSNLVIDESL